MCGSKDVNKQLLRVVLFGIYPLIFVKTNQIIIDRIVERCKHLVDQQKYDEEDWIDIEKAVKPVLQQTYWWIWDTELLESGVKRLRNVCKLYQDNELLNGQPTTDVNDVI